MFGYLGYHVLCFGLVFFDDITYDAIFLQHILDYIKLTYRQYQRPGRMIKNDYDYLFKFILIGNTSMLLFYEDVGKSCVLMRLLQGRFKNQHQPTLGVQFGSKMVSACGKDVKIQIWDTAGQESFKSITRAYYKGSIAAILVFDLTSTSSFQDLSNWLHEIRNHSHQKIHLLLIGNKKDLDSEREVSYESAEAFAKENGFLSYIETSALTGENVEKPFNELTCRILKQIETGQINVENDVPNGIKPGKKFRQKYPIAHVQLLKQPKKPQSQEQCKC